MSHFVQRGPSVDLEGLSFSLKGSLLFSEHNPASETILYWSKMVLFQPEKVLYRPETTLLCPRWHSAYIRVPSVDLKGSLRTLYQYENIVCYRNPRQCRGVGATPP